ncbi:pentapeptide repeat-containing protein [Geitlerinema sp. PCC 9228]|uniref:pentapeptide repeat-containing protein n=1 Tax=Geitlerinema sp. PCC 9228 TaxID=111611 RepID=UPI00147FB3DC|nr:pentapeptide repeat-containing protein [Geitlerinema sp. PCC 9228]
MHIGFGIKQDFAESDLSETDLKGTDLSDANVENAHFGENPGISFNEKRDLISRGAIFDDEPNKPSYKSKPTR